MEAPSPPDRVFDLLLREDKYYLGGGDGFIFAPPLPLWLDRPGFWDGFHYFLHAFRPGFTLTLVDEAGRELPLRLLSRSWTPAVLDVRYAYGDLLLRERRAVLPGGRALSECTITNAGGSREELAMVAWTAQEGADLADRAGIAGGMDAVHFRLLARDAQGRGLELPMDATLSVTGGQASCIVESQHMRSYPNPPFWPITPFSDHWGPRGLDGAVRHALEPANTARTLVYLGVSRRFALEPRSSETVRTMLRLQPVERAVRLTVPRNSRPAPGTSHRAWAAYFHSAPTLRCSDPWIEHHFPYRWYGLRLNFLDPAGDYRHPTVAEGPEYFHAAVSYSAWCHVRELRWLPDPARARGVLRTFLQRQRPDGSFPGILYLRGEHPSAFYVADWGGSLDALQEVHPDPHFLAECYQPLARYAEFMRAQRDSADTGLYDVRDPYETGQETMSRYIAVDASADAYHFSNRLRLKGVDTTVYMYRLHRALARAAAAAGDLRDMRDHDAVADRIGEAVLSRMWDPERELFCDVDPGSGQPTGVRAAICFYPYLTDIAGAEHLAGLHRNLFDPASFWSRFPVPSTAADDPTFSASAEWKGVRQSCSWNGRVWPMTNSHLVDALGTAAIALDDSLRSRTADLLTSFLRMLCFAGDPARPNCFEHYSPVTGQASLYRGIDDYQHSWINDLIIRYVAGFRPTADGFLVDPFPFAISSLRLVRLPFRGHDIDLDVTRASVRATVGGRIFEAAAGEPLLVSLP